MCVIKILASTFLLITAVHASDMPKGEKKYIRIEERETPTREIVIHEIGDVFCRTDTDSQGRSQPICEFMLNFTQTYEKSKVGLLTDYYFADNDEVIIEKKNIKKEHTRPVLFSGNKYPAGKAIHINLNADLLKQVEDSYNNLQDDSMTSKKFEQDMRNQWLHCNNQHDFYIKLKNKKTVIPDDKRF